jgi:serine/threonine protein kinase
LDPTSLSAPASASVPLAREENALRAGTKIGRFVVGGLLGKGGMGEVYAAYDPELNRSVAIKVLGGGADSASAEVRARFMREARAIARVSHPNVIVVYDVGTLGDRVFIAMELIEGHTLRYWTHARSRTWPEVLEVFVSAGRGLAAAHERELVHRDFKPDNVMIAADGQVRVMDFGLVQLRGEGGAQGEAAPAPAAPTRIDRPAAAPASDDDLLSTRQLNLSAAPTMSLTRTIVGGATERTDVDLTRTGVSLGTPAYMSPEQFRNQPTDARTDQFSFCVALYEAIYGERPFAGGDVHSISANVCGGRVREAPKNTPVPSWMRDVLLRGLAVEPARRWPSMTALLAELARHPAAASRQRFADAAAAKLAGVWEAPSGGRPVETPAKIDAREAFAATGKSYAAKAWEGASQILDRYARRWSELYVEACEATHVRGEQSAEVLDLRMSCLQEGLADLAALVRMFRQATTEVVENAVAAADALGTLERCENIELLRATVRPPADAAARAEVDRLRLGLAEVRALCRVGRINDGLAAAAPLERAARALGYGPLLADLLVSVGRLSEERGDMDEAARLCEEGLYAAIASRHEEVAAEAATLLVGYAALDYARAGIWSGIAEALLRRVGGHELLWAWLYNNRAVRQAAGGHLREGLAEARRALSAKEKVLAPGHPDIGISVANVAVYLDDLGETAEAVSNGQRAVEIAEGGFGPEHPRTALMLTNYGEFLGRAGRWGEAVEAARRALAIFEREAHPSGVFLFVSIAVLGTAHLGAGDVERALELLERANAIGAPPGAVIAQRAQARFALARALDRAGRDPARAAALAAAARDEYRSAPATPGIERELGAIAAWLDARTPAVRD